MPDAAPTPPPLRDMQSTAVTLVTTHEDGHQTTDALHIVHAPGATPSACVTHDTTHCGCRS